MDVTVNSTLALLVVEENKELKAKVKRYEEALKQYADSTHWCNGQGQSDYEKFFNCINNGYEMAQFVLKEQK